MGIKRCELTREQFGPPRTPHPATRLVPSVYSSVGIQNSTVQKRTRPAEQSSWHKHNLYSARHNNLPALPSKKTRKTRAHPVTLQALNERRTRIRKYQCPYPARNDYQNHRAISFNDKRKNQPQDRAQARGTTQLCPVDTINRARHWNSTIMREAQSGT